MINRCWEEVTPCAKWKSLLWTGILIPPDRFVHVFHMSSQSICWNAEYVITHQGVDDKQSL